jgi:hypothetical protein
MIHFSFFTTCQDVPPQISKQKSHKQLTHGFIITLSERHTGRRPTNHETRNLTAAAWFAEGVVVKNVTLKTYPQNGQQDHSQQQSLQVPVN